MEMWTDNPPTTFPHRLLLLLAPPFQSPEVEYLAVQSDSEGKEAPKAREADKADLLAPEAPFMPAERTLSSFGE